jgi:hypothetical protein
MPTRACLQTFFKRSAFVVVVAWAVTLSSSAMGFPEAFVSMRSDVATLQENFNVLKSALGETDCRVSRYIIQAAFRELLRRTKTNLD